VQGMTECR